MVAFLIILIALIILVFAAVPFDMTEGIVNSAITTIQWSINILLGVLTWVGNVIGSVVYGVLNASTAWIRDALAGVGIPIDGFTLTWTPLVWEIALGSVNFASMGYDTSFSPIGIALSNWVTDPFTANALGSIGLVILAGVVFFVVLKTPKPRMGLSLKNKQFGKRKKGR